MPRLLDNLFAKLPCNVTYVTLPTRKRNLFDPRDADLQSVAQTVTEGQYHLGVIVDEDAQHAAFITDRGSLVTPKEIARLLIEIIQCEDHAAQVIATSSLVPDVASWVTGRDAKVVDGGENVEHAVRMLIEGEAAMTLSGDGRVWFRRKYPTCDALLVLAKLLQALSMSDASFSDVIARIRNDA